MVDIGIFLACLGVFFDGLGVLAYLTKKGRE